jgi:diguanylate cyclase (GGDEF)-like protein
VSAIVIAADSNMGSDQTMPSAHEDALAKSASQLRQAELRQEAIFAIAALASSGRDLQAILSDMHRIVVDLLSPQSFIMALYDAGSDFATYIGAEPDSDDPAIAGIEHALAWHLVRERLPIRGSGAQLSELIPTLSDAGVDTLHWAGVPIVEGEDVQGALLLRARADQPAYGNSDTSLLKFIGSQVLAARDHWHAQQLEEADLQDRNEDLVQEVIEHQRSERLQSALFSVSELSNTAIGPGAFYAAVHDIIGDVIDCRNICVAQIARDVNELQFPYYVNDRQPIPAPRRPGRGIIEYVLRTHSPLRIDMSNEASRANMAALVDAGEISGVDAGLRAWLGVPLVCANHVIGVLSVQTYEPGLSYDDRDEELLSFISYQIGNALERQQAAASLRAANATLEQRVSERTRQLQNQMEAREQIELQLKHETLHDFLTGLPNRAFLCDRLVRSLALQARDPSKTFAVLFMDLDRFKVINDSAGHIVGDALLKEVGRRLATCVRTPDMVARLGGDEFAILIENLDIVDTAVRVANRVIEDMQEPINVDGKELFTSVSIGIAISDQSYTIAEEMLRDADIAMYRAKGNDKQRFEIFNENLHLEAIAALEVEGDLHRAIARREFVPYFQQIVRLHDGAVIGYESLLRWIHPERGVLTPASFLAIAEASGSVEAIDWQMFDLTCAAVSQLLEPGQYVNLNFSPRQFRDKNMDERLLALLRQHGVATNQVRIEVTEGALIDNPDQVSEIIDRLHQAGVLTSLDDFGTGYSSLGYLHRFHLHAVKIDRSFVAPLTLTGTSASEAVVRAILALSKSQGLDVIAEGVETVGQRDALLALGCTMGQGYFYSRPKALGAFDQ